VPPRFPLVVMALTAPLWPVIAACGGDTGKGTDEAFMRDLCVAFANYGKAVDAALKDASTSGDPGKGFAKLAAVIDQFAGAFKQAEPPADIKDWHSRTANALSAAAAQLRTANDFSALEALGNSLIPDPPGDAQKRLEGVAAKIKECQGLAMFQ
jgi:hypothetical protein